ncbi:SAV2148 family HEPN domain-containing protein, partial [Streptomyces anulatus]
SFLMLRRPPLFTLDLSSDASVVFKRQRQWVVAAAGPAGQEWVQRAVAVREVSRRKGYLLDPADDNVLSFLTLPQLRELMVQHWPCFEPYFDDRRDVELALDELEVARNVVSRNRALNEAVLAQAERASARLLDILGSGAGVPSADRLPVDAVEELVGDRYADVVSVHPDRVRLQRQLPAEDLFGGARRLDAIGIGLNLLVQNFSGRRLVRLAESGCRVRLLFINPASSAVRRRERELGLKKGELSRSVEMNILHMRRVRSKLRDPGAFEIQVF